MHINIVGGLSVILYEGVIGWPRKGEERISSGNHFGIEVHSHWAKDNYSNYVKESGSYHHAGQLKSVGGGIAETYGSN